MKQIRLLTLLALLAAVVSGAWATPNSIVINGTPQVGDKSISLTYHFDPNNVPGITGYAPTLKVKCAADNKWDETTLSLSEVSSGTTNISLNTLGEFESGKTYEVCFAYYNGNWVDDVFQTFVPAAPVTYKVMMKDGVKDADKWTITPNEGLKEGDPVTLTYSGRLKVKGVKAEKAKPDLLSGVFSVSSTKKVNFSKGNLRYASGAWSFFDNQYDYYTSYSADAWDKFGWSTSTTTYGMNTSDQSSDYSGDFVDWGATMGTGWFTLSSAEWTYLFNTRSASTVGGTSNVRYAKAKVNDVQGVILFPDTYTHPDGVTAPTGVNAEDATGWNGNNYSFADWTKMESAGCVFLPAAGYRSGSSVGNVGTRGYYWSATPDVTDYVYRVYFNQGNLNPASSNYRYNGASVRLVQAVAPNP